MDQICERNDCTGCGTCAVLCPQQCIEMLIDREGFCRPHINESACIDCGKCIRSCHILIDMPKKAPAFYMGWNRDKEVLKACSSGGIFDAISSVIFERGGQVFGVAYDEINDGLKFMSADDAVQIGPLRLSKYYEARMGDVLLQVRSALRVGYEVLFTGTGCQVAALYAGLGEDAESSNLVTMEVLCHGVTSKAVVDSYLKSKEETIGAKIVDYKFRCKEPDRGWHDGGGTRMMLKLENADQFILDPSNSFMEGFNKNVFLRESCYCCRYCGLKRIADYTAADFWGVTSSHAEEERLKQGVSLLLVNSDKAKKMLPDIMKYAELAPVDPNDAIPYNKALVSPNERPAKRDAFFIDMMTYGFDNTLKRYYRFDGPKYFVSRLLRKVIGDRPVELVKRIIRAG